LGKTHKPIMVLKWGSRHLQGRFNLILCACSIYVALMILALIS
jgi:hypothetical protein